LDSKKPLFVLWSKAAVIAAGAEIATLQALLLEEAADIVSQAKDWFHHSLPSEAGDAGYVCIGNELADKWEIFVQVARYKSLPPLPDDHPTPALRGKAIKFPEPLKRADNEAFTPFADLTY
jgi:hypothetical protein